MQPATIVCLPAREVEKEKCTRSIETYVRKKEKRERVQQRFFPHQNRGQCENAKAECAAEVLCGTSRMTESQRKTKFVFGVSRDTFRRWCVLAPPRIDSSSLILRVSWHCWYFWKSRATLNHTVTNQKCACMSVIVKCTMRAGMSPSNLSPATRYLHRVDVQELTGKERFLSL